MYILNFFLYLSLSVVCFGDLEQGLSLHQLRGVEAGKCHLNDTQNIIYVSNSIYIKTHGIVKEFFS